jgi:beta-1,4-mannosyltransferase
MHNDFAAAKSPTMGMSSVEPALRVGIWPGRARDGNAFTTVFAEGLESAGAVTIDVADPRDIAEPLDVLHIHWAEQVFWHREKRLDRLKRTLSTLAAIARVRRKGTRVVWMVHNLRPHEVQGIRKLLWPMLRYRLPQLIHGFMTLAPSTVAVVRGAYGGRFATMPAAAAYHPSYAPAPDLPDRAACRAALGISGGTVFGLLGRIRPYKGAERLIAAFRAHPDPDARLLIAGKPLNPDYAETLRALAGDDARILLRFDDLDDRTFAMATLASDVIVLPYGQYLHSGALIYALSHGRPVLTSAAPFASDVAGAVGAEWVQCYAGELSAEALRDYRLPRTPINLAPLAPSHLGATALAFYRSLGATPGTASENRK